MNLVFGLPVVMMTGLVSATAPVSPAAAQRPSSCVDNVSTRSDALAVAWQCDMAVEIEASTTENVREWALPDGGFRREISAAPVRVLKDGSWIPTDLTLERQPDGSIAPRAHRSGLTISGGSSDPGAHELATLGTAGEAVAMGWDGELPAPSLDGNRATYAEVRPGIDLVVEATPTGAETFYIVKNRAAASHVDELTVTITGPNVASHQLAGDGTLTLLDEQQRVVAMSPAPQMWDARTDARTGRPAAMRRMASRATTRRAAGRAGVDLTITPSPGFLTDARTVYPVTIDPEITYDDPTWDTWVRQGVTEDLSLKDYLEVGYRAGAVARAFVNFNVAALKGKHITDATIGLWNYKSGSCSPNTWELWTVTGSNTGTRWDTQPTWKSRDGYASATKGGPGGCTATGFVYAPAEQFFQRQSDENRNIAYLGIRASNEACACGNKLFFSQNYADTSKSPFAVVDYVDQTDFGVTAGNAFTVGAEITGAEVEGRLAVMGYAPAEISQAMAGTTAELSTFSAEEPLLGTPSEAGDDPADDTLFDEAWSDMTGGGQPPAVTPDAPASGTNPLPYVALTDEEENGEATMGTLGTGIQSIRASWRDVRGVYSVIRQGYFMVGADGRDKGYGVVKLAQKHNLDITTARAVMKRPRSFGYVSGKKWNYLSYDLHHMKCWWSGIIRKCKSVEKTTILVSHDFRFLSDGYSFGVVTAYCTTYVGKCPSWVTRRLN